MISEYVLTLNSKNIAIGKLRCIDVIVECVIRPYGKMSQSVPLTGTLGVEFNVVLMTEGYRMLQCMNWWWTPPKSGDICTEKVQGKSSYHSD
jgi:hypothetical protein